MLHGGRQVGTVISRVYNRRVIATGALVAGCAALSACATGPERRRQTVRIEDFGDPKRDGSDALQRALSVAARQGLDVEIASDVVVRMRRPVAVPSDVSLVGSGRLVAAADLSRMVVLSRRGSGLRELSLDGGGHRVGALVSVSRGARDATLEGVTLSHALAGLTIADSVAGVRASTCDFEGLATGVALRGATSDVSVSGSRFVDWANRAVWVVGTQDGAPERLAIRGNWIGPPLPTGAVRQPIQVNGVDSRPIRQITVADNVVRGSGRSHDDPKKPGTADLISLHRCQSFRVTGNRVVDGGDVGITVARQSTDGVISNNVCLRNDSVGICVGSLQSDFVRDVVVKDNVCEENGQDRLGDGRPWARAGILVVRGTGIEVTGNTIRDGGAGKQINALSLRATQAIVRDNQMSAPQAVVITDDQSKVLR